LNKRLYPYVVFLPRDRKQRVLEAIFGSKSAVNILNFFLRQGVTEKVYQKDLIANLGYSNKTVIDHLKTLTELAILDDLMERVDSGGRTVWLKAYTLTDLGKWFALLLVEEESLPREEKAAIVRNAFRSYMRWIWELSEKLGMPREELSEIFEQEMK